MSIAKDIIAKVVNDYDQQIYTPSTFFTEVLDLSREWETSKFFKFDDDENHDEIKEWLYHSGRKVILLEKVRRALTLSGLSTRIIKEELIALNKSLLNNNKKLKLHL